MQEEMIKDMEELFERIRDEELENSGVKNLPDRIELYQAESRGYDANNTV